jgi:hypothetical protein
MRLVVKALIRYGLNKDATEGQAIDWNNEPFVGMWQDREDMKDSSKWVRSLRQQEWA